MNLKYAVGLDVSSKKIDACMSIIDEKQRVVVKSSTQITNTRKGFENLAQWIIKHKKEDIPVVNCMEAMVFIMKIVRIICLRRDLILLLFYPIRQKSI